MKGIRITRLPDNILIDLKQSAVSTACPANFTSVVIPFHVHTSYITTYHSQEYDQYLVDLLYLQEYYKV